MLVSGKIQPACGLILPKISCQSGCGCNKLWKTIIDIFWSHHLQVIEKGMFALMYHSIIIK
jgi:hypothetical protein